MILNNLPKRKNRKMPKNRLGRGYASYGGHTTVRGQKGQKSRTGHKSLLFFEGGNVPLYRRLPKLRGFKRSWKEVNQVINVSYLDKNFEDGAIVSLETLKEKKVIKKKMDNVKILGDGELEKSLTIKGLDISKSAKKKVEDAGGKVVIKEEDSKEQK